MHDLFGALIVVAALGLAVSVPAWLCLADAFGYQLAHRLGPMAGRVPPPDDEGLLAHEPSQRWRFTAGTEHPRQEFLRIGDRRSPLLLTEGELND